MMGVAQQALRQLVASADASVADLATALGESRRVVGHALLILHRRGLIERVALGVYRLSDAGRAFLAADQRVRPGPQGPNMRIRQPRHTLRERIWTALGNRRKGTLPDLLRLTTTGHERNALNNAQRYLGLLEHAGYVLRHRRRAPGQAPTSPGHVQWLVLRWTGPCTPIARHRFTALYDPNTGHEYVLHEAATRTTS